MRQGERAARDRLILAVLPLVAGVALRTRCGDADGEERIAIANYELVRKIDRFDPDRGRLSTFCYSVVRRALQAEHYNQRTIRVPRSAKDICRSSELYQRAFRGARSLAADAADSLESTGLAQTVPLPAAAEREELWQQIKALHYFERLAVRCRLLGISQGRLGRRFGVTRSAVGQWWRRGRLALRAKLSRAA